jgi:hypothetical protein
MEDEMMVQIEGIDVRKGNYLTATECDSEEIILDMHWTGPSL